MKHSHGAGFEHSSSTHDGHTLSFAIYRNSFIILLVLTVITVGAAQVDFGLLNFVVAMLIASIKAVIVGLFFMHLKYENPVIWACVLIPVLLLGILLAGLFIDNPMREVSKPVSVSYFSSSEFRA
jgi:cytochrome c oxidase subunit 4